ncbi:MAG: redoxin domain-containing protein [Bacteroidales bacterium]|nr:redoxin domain-containing protein [Bacteroidales bacterium]
MRFLIAFSLLLCANFIYSAEYSVSITLKGYSNQKIYLLKVFGDKVRYKDSLLTNVNGEAVAQFNDKDIVGMYKFVFGNENNIEFIFNKEDIKIRTSAQDPLRNIEIITSRENKLYYTFLSKQALFKRKLDLLTALVDGYPQNEPFYKTSFVEFERERTAYNHFVDSIVLLGSNSFASKLINAKREIYVSPSLTAPLRNEYIKKHYFDNINFADTSFFYTDVFTHKAISYLGLWASRNTNPEMVELQLKKALDTIIAKTIPHPATFDFMIEYLIGGFESMQYNNLVQYLADVYSNTNSCEGEGEKKNVERKVLYHKKLAIGKQAPNFSVKTIDDKTLQLTDFNNQYLILYIWATHCSHCQESMPDMYKLSKFVQKDKVAIVTISVDKKKTDVSNFFKAKAIIDLPTVCDELSWDGKLINDYNIYATPTIIVIKDQKIVFKPMEVSQLAEFLQSKGLVNF